MYTIISETFDMIGDGIAASVPVSLLIWGFATMYQMMFGYHRRPSLKLLAAIVYAGLLIWGTCISRVDSVREFFTWGRSSMEGFFTFDFSITRPAQVWHQFMNVLLFVPFGFLTRSYARPSRGPAAFVIMGFMLSCLVESFQGFHGLVFDIGDVVFNTIGTWLGCAAYFPAVRALEHVRDGLRRSRRAPGRA